MLVDSDLMGLLHYDKKIRTYYYKYLDYKIWDEEREKGQHLNRLINGSGPCMADKKDQVDFEMHSYPQRSPKWWSKHDSIIGR